MYENRHSSGKGLGIFATERIPLGTRLICEDALFILKQPTAKNVYNAFLQLPPEVKQEYLSLTDSVFNEATTPTPEQQRALAIEKYYLSRAEIHELGGKIDSALKVFAIFANNSFELDNEEQPALGIFMQATRLNHSCLPNAVHTWNSTLRKRTVHAVREIQAGEEITITYIRPLQAREQRVGLLQERYGFTCDCAACNLETDFGRASDSRRKRIAELEGQFIESLKGETPHLAEGDMFVEMLGLMEEEGLHTWERGSM